jgi:hypothetical protein
MKESVSSLINDIHERLKKLESSLPKHLDAMAVSQTAKLPWKALLGREALIWRMAELSRSAVENFEKDRLVSAIVLTRAAVETFAALWYLWDKIAAIVESSRVGDIDTYLMKLISGVKIDDPVFPQAINILTIIEKLDKKEKFDKAFSDQYAILCEYTHPNAAGTTQTYLHHNREQLTTDLGLNTRTANHTKLLGLGNLSAALSLFEMRYNDLVDLIPAFARLCENELERRPTG